MLGLIKERLGEVNCSPDRDLGHIHQRAASCPQVFPGQTAGAGFGGEQSQQGKALPGQGSLPAQGPPKTQPSSKRTLLEQSPPQREHSCLHRGKPSPAELSFGVSAHGLHRAGLTPAPLSSARPPAPLPEGAASIPLRVEGGSGRFLQSMSPFGNSYSSWT